MSKDKLKNIISVIPALSLPCFCPDCLITVISSFSEKSLKGENGQYKGFLPRIKCGVEMTRKKGSFAMTVVAPLFPFFCHPEGAAATEGSGVILNTFAPLSINSVKDLSRMRDRHKVGDSSLTLRMTKGGGLFQNDKYKLRMTLTMSLFLAVAFFVFAPGAMAAVTTWQGDDVTNPTYWNTAANWDTNAVPTVADDVVFDNNAGT